MKRSKSRSCRAGSTSVMPRQKHSVELAAEPRPWHRDAARSGETHDVVHGEEVGRVIHLPHEIELVVDGRRDVGGHTFRVCLGRIAAPRALLGEGGQRLLGRGEALAQLLRVVRLPSSSSGEGQALREAQGLGDGLRRLGEEPAHLGRRLQVAFGVEREQAAGRLKRRPMADAGDDVEQRAPRGIVHGDVVGGEHRHAEPVGEAAAAQQVASGAATVAHHRADPQPAGASGGEARERILLRGAMRSGGGGAPKVEGAAGASIFGHRRRFDASRRRGLRLPSPRCSAWFPSPFSAFAFDEGGCRRRLPFGKVPPRQPRLDVGFEGRGGQGDEP